ncbi:MAG: hypothetical protein A3F35_00445 [Candidatus Woykebacteria bacterium RIFCSPHIGHO2_12_FULL_45_10]|uniref:Glutaredoxin domain-containing protein n=1 Tax=Candidatus Woykebacteria bacterium RIFCSPHIGHO2_12_FULL_45_10 TaxID=1802603 RepID=A0A1G1WQC4_9BACT|nr:MAG: hypothetical protein A3F35_00445 [Candidatus Woykebacteria bacterium RIFCSPHIGHO2_12_FULL_45_10]
MKKVKIYTTTTCPYCRMEKDFLDSKKVQYEEVLIDHDTKAAQEMMNLSGQLGVPFTSVTDENGKEATILGFDKREIAYQIGISVD